MDKQELAVIRVDIPEGIHIGGVIGKGGQVFKRVRDSTGCTITINQRNREVVCNGGKAAMAGDMIRQHILGLEERVRKLVRLGAPVTVAGVMVLSSSLTLTGQLAFTEVKLSEGEREAFKDKFDARGKAYKIYSANWQPHAMGATRKYVQDLGKLFSRVTIDQKPLFVKSSEAPQMQADFSTLIINEAASYETNVIAARFSLAERCVNKHLEDILCNLEDAGHQLFLTGYHMPFQLDELNPMTFSELQKLKYGAHIRSLFSSWVTKTYTQKLHDFLIHQLGFQLLEHKSIVVLHLDGITGEFENDRVVISFFNRPGSQLKLRKIKSTTERLMLLSHHNDGGLDFRLKLLKHRYKHETDPRLNEAAVAMAGRCTLQDEKVQLDTRDSKLFAINSARFKEKDVYEGSFQASSGELHTIRMSVMEVTQQSMPHWEVTGKCKELASNLSKTDISTLVRTSVQKYVTTLVEFCSVLSKV